MTAVSTIPAAAAAQIGIHIMLSFLSPVDTDCVFTALEPEAGAYDLAAEAAALVGLAGAAAGCVVVGAVVGSVSPSLPPVASVLTGAFIREQQRGYSDAYLYHKQ